MAADELVRKRAAITGVGLVTPLGADLETVWRALVAGASGVDEVGDEAEPLWARRAGRVADPELPAALLDRLRGEGRFLNRGGRLAVVAAAAALAAAAPSDAVPPERRALYLATGDLTTADCHRLRPAVAAATADFTAPLDPVALNRAATERVYPFYLLETLANNPYSALTAAFDLMGPGTTLASHSPAGVQALALADRCLRLGRADAALVVASTAWLAPLPLAEMAALGLLATDGDARPLDGERHGFVAGEGAVAVLLEPSAAAAARGAPVLAEVETVVEAGDHAALVEALRAAGVAADTLGAVLVPGDASRAGDDRDLEAVADLLGAAAARTPVAALKAASGHLGAASDLLEVVVAALAAGRGLLPPTLGFGAGEAGRPALSVASLAQSVTQARVLAVSRGLGGQLAAVVVSAPGTP